MKEQRNLGQQRIDNFRTPARFAFTCQRHTVKQIICPVYFPTKALKKPNIMERIFLKVTPLCLKRNFTKRRYQTNNLPDTISPEASYRQDQFRDRITLDRCDYVTTH